MLNIYKVRQLGQYFSIFGLISSSFFPSLPKISDFLETSNFFRPAFVAIAEAPTLSESEIFMSAQKPEYETRQVLVTAYSSTKDQTDDTPFITAMGTWVKDGIVAANFLEFGTKVRFPEIFGEKIFVVEDRMARKNSHKVDIWMPTRELALNFGAKPLVMEILK